MNYNNREVINGSYCVIGKYNLQIAVGTILKQVFSNSDLLITRIDITNSGSIRRISGVWKNGEVERELDLLTTYIFNNTFHSRFAKSYINIENLLDKFINDDYIILEDKITFFSEMGEGVNYSSEYPREQFFINNLMPVNCEKEVIRKIVLENKKKEKFFINVEGKVSPLTNSIVFWNEPKMFNYEDAFTNEAISIPYPY